MVKALEERHLSWYISPDKFYGLYFDFYLSADKERVILEFVGDMPELPEGFNLELVHNTISRLDSKRNGEAVLTLVDCRVNRMWHVLMHNLKITFLDLSCHIDGEIPHVKRHSSASWTYEKNVYFEAANDQS